MTNTPNSHQPRQRTRTLWLAIGIPAGVILLLAGTAVALLVWLNFSPASTVNSSATLTDAQSVAVGASNARMDFVPSVDDEIHVTMTGTYTGSAPTLTAQMDEGVATVDVACPRVAFFMRCDLTLTVALPAGLEVTAQGINGRISLTELTGDIRVRTTNGSIEVDRTSGSVNLATTNGRITVRDTASEVVSAETVNGAVELDFSAPPSAVNATSTNGSVTVHVPDDGEPYAVTATTVNGTTDTETLATDPTAERTIVAETVNGSITVATARR